MSKLKNIYKQAKKNEKLQKKGKLNGANMTVSTKGISYKDFKKMIEEANLDPKSAEAKARKFFYTYTQLDPDIVPVGQKEMIQRPTSLPYEKQYDTKKALQTPIIINPVVPTGNVTPTDNVTPKQKKRYEGQDWSGDFRGIPANSGNPYVRVVPTFIDPNGSVVGRQAEDIPFYQPEINSSTKVPVQVSPSTRVSAVVDPNLFMTGRWNEDIPFYQPNIEVVSTKTPVYIDPNSYMTGRWNEDIGFYQTGGQVVSQGGKQSQSEEQLVKFIQGLAQVLKAEPEQVYQAAQKNQEAFANAWNIYNQTQDIQKAAQTFVEALQSQAKQQAQVARHGSKLNYLKALKHQCADDEELVYYKTGGKVGCGCRKKENGGTVQGNYKDAVTKFKMAKCGSKMKKHQQGGSLNGVPFIRRELQESLK